jgi:predicted transcriptional regulator
MTKSLVAQLRGEGKTYAEIGKVLGLTRQRVHQIYTGYKTIPSKMTRNKRNKRERLQRQFIKESIRLRPDIARKYGLW